jgi:hypothetical protein
MFHRMEYVLFHYVDDSGSGVFNGHPERLGHFPTNRFTGRINIQIESAASRLSGTQAAENQLRIGDRWPRAA